MKAVMISIQPKWVEKIMNGEKTIEVRKTAPKLETPFKCFVYCTLGKPYLGFHTEYENGIAKNVYTDHLFGQTPYFNGKVIGEFICDCIEVLEYRHVNLFHINRYVPTSNNPDYSWEEHSCLKNNEAVEYGKFKPLYGLHISNLKIYDKPKEISEFKGRKLVWRGMNHIRVFEEMEKPPQSWCYVEV